MVRDIRIQRNVEMQTRDGVTLRSDVYRPDDDQKYPPLLMRTPYSKEIEDTDYLSVMDAVRAGYVVVAQDCRGRFDSEGEWAAADPVREGRDTYDAVEWAAVQPWSTGDVGMIGASYVGMVQWSGAMERPPHLKAISPWIIGHGAGSNADGTIPIGLNTQWVTFMGMEIAKGLEAEGKDVTELRELIERAVLEPEILYGHLPLSDIPLAKFEGVRDIWAQRVKDVSPETAFRWDFSKIDVPIAQAGGWYDMFPADNFACLSGMQEQGGSQVARANQHLLVGPWMHSRPLASQLNEVSFGFHAEGVPPRPAIAVQTQYVLDFFDKHLRGNDQIELPAVRYFVMGRNEWRDAQSWPPPQTSWQRYYLRGDGQLSQEAPQSEAPDVFEYDPADPVPSVGGRLLKTPWIVPGPADQSHIEQRGDVLTYSSEVLDEDTEVTGPLKLHLFASTTAKDTDFVAKLCDVYPDGRSILIAHGTIRARFRNSLAELEFLTPGEVYEFVVDLTQTSNVFKKGHRIRIDVTSSNFPLHDRNMNTGNAFGVDAEGIAATQTIFHEADHASYIDLPTQPA